MPNRVTVPLEDPILLGGGQNNICVYAGNDPANVTDPNGKDGSDDPNGGASPNLDKCKPPWQCGYAGVVNTGAGVRRGYNCTNGIYTRVRH